MYLSLNWLKDFVKIPSSVSAEEVGQKLTLHTVEVEGVINEVEKYKNVVVGKILEVKKHPDADRLSLAKVEVSHSTRSGQGKILDIVCGASNIEPGQLVPVALPGAILPNGLEIKEAEVRGEKSQGMLCAVDELGLGDDHSGILILEKRAKIGEDFSRYLGVSDIVLEVDNKSLSNRPDLWGHYGIARELSALLGLKLKDLKKIDFSKSQKGAKKEKAVKVEVKDEKLCPRYMAVTISGIEVKESPKWIQDRLVAVGSRPINNIVDITNYVMLELGQPLHAFDAEMLDEIIIRRAKKDELIKTLDGEERKLDDSMLVIADSQKPIAIAGVMGGENSEVSKDTKAIILEAANFDPVSVRRTSTKLALRTEASSRFEKSLDPNLCEYAVSRVFELIKKDCSKAEISAEAVDVKNFELKQGPIKLDMKWLAEKIGENIEVKEALAILEKLGFEIEPIARKNESVFNVIIPTWRATKDVSLPEDLVEEVARIYGYNKIKSSLPEVKMQAPLFNEERIFERQVKEILSRGAKLSEVYNYSFVGEDQLLKLDINFDSHVRLANPIAKHQTLMRQNLAPNLFENIKFNQSRYDEIDIFEIGSVYFDFGGEFLKDSRNQEKLLHQEKRLAIAIAHQNADKAMSRVKGILEHLLGNFGLSAIFEEAEELVSWSAPGLCAKIEVREKSLGNVSLLSPKIGNKIGIKKSVAIAEINFQDLYRLASLVGGKRYQELPKFPPLARDLAFVVDKKILYNKIKQEIESFDKLISAVELFDVYEGEKLGSGKKNLAFHIIYQADRTLTGEEVDKLQKKLSQYLEKKFGAQIRDF